MNGMSKVVRTITHLIYWFIFLYGFYLVLHGHLTPGGGFQGGAVIASGIALMMVANGVGSTGYHEGSFLSAESAGLIIFLLLGLLGVGKTFMFNFLAVGRFHGAVWFFGKAVEGINSGRFNTGGIIPLMNLAVAIEVIGALGAIVYFMIRPTEEKA